MTDHHTCSMPQLKHRRLDYPSGSCVPAELPSVSSNAKSLTRLCSYARLFSQPTIQLNTGAMPKKIPRVWGLAPNVSARKHDPAKHICHTERNSKMSFFESVTCTNLRPSLIRPIGHLLPPRGRRDFVHAANIDQKTTSVNPTLQTWHCPVRVGVKTISVNCVPAFAGANLSHPTNCKVFCRV